VKGKFPLRYGFVLCDIFMCAKRRCPKPFSVFSITIDWNYKAKYLYSYSVFICAHNISIPNIIIRTYCRRFSRGKSQLIPLVEFSCHSYVQLMFS